MDIRATTAGARLTAGILPLALALLVLPAGKGTAQQQTPEEMLAESNNPLAALQGINLNEYYAPALYDADAVSNTFNIQGVLIPVRRHLHLFHLIRVTLPVTTVPATSGAYESGLGDLTVQDAFKFSHAGAKTEFGIGPLLVMPTATPSSLGAGKWQAGVNVVVVRLLEGGSVIGGSGTWQTSFAGDSDRPKTNLATFQTQVALALGQSGCYISSSPIWTFDFENDRYLIPFSLGIGNAFKIGKTIVNATMEPQFTIYHKGEQQPAVQLFFGLTLQRKK